MTARCDLPADLETDPEKVCELLVGLPDVRILGALQTAVHVELHIETRADIAGCPACGVVATGKGRRVLWLSDLTCFGMPVRLAWHNRRWRCVEASCPMGSWTEVDERIAGSRLCLTDRAARWARRQVGEFGRSVQEVADTLRSDWHTANDAVIAFGEALLAHRGRFGAVASLGLDEHLFVREGPRRRRCFVTVICDVVRGQPSIGMSIFSISSSSVVTSDGNSGRSLTWRTYVVKPPEIRSARLVPPSWSHVWQTLVVPCRWQARSPLLHVAGRAHPEVWRIAQRRRTLSRARGHAFPLNAVTTSCSRRQLRWTRSVVPRPLCTTRPAACRNA